MAHIYHFPLLPLRTSLNTLESVHKLPSFLCVSFHPLLLSPRALLWLDITRDTPDPVAGIFFFIPPGGHLGPFIYVRIPLTVFFAGLS